jgi:uncharacterized protein (TIGR03435 family)
MSTTSFKRLTATAAIAGLALAAQQLARFDVSVIKPADLSNPQRGIWIAPGNRSVTISGLTTGEFIQRTYSIQESQISGGPPWRNTERFDITAKVESATAPDTATLRAMLEQLIADRFALKFHRETKMLQGYALLVGKTGPKLADAAEPGPDLKVSRGQLQASRVSLSMLVNMLSRYPGRPIFDDTGLKGSYDFTSRPFRAFDIHGKAGSTGPQTGVEESAGRCICHRPHRETFGELI